MSSKGFCGPTLMPYWLQPMWPLFWVLIFTAQLSQEALHVSGISHCCVPHCTFDFILLAACTVFSGLSLKSEWKPDLTTLTVCIPVKLAPHRQHQGLQSVVTVAGLFGHGCSCLSAWVAEHGVMNPEEPIP